jgi:hypothetical protein
MRKWAKEHGLLLANAGLFFSSVSGEQPLLVRVLPELAKRVPGRRGPGGRVGLPSGKGVPGIEACCRTPLRDRCLTAQSNPPHSEELLMRTLVRTTLLALLLLAAPALPTGAATAASASAAAQANPIHVASGSSEGAWAAGTSPTPSPGDTASTGPANPGTGESAQNESTRLNYFPWVIAGIAVLLVIAILILRRRRNTTIVG